MSEQRELVKFLMDKFFSSMNSVFSSGISDDPPEVYVAKMNAIQVEKDPERFFLRDGIHLALKAV